MAGIRCQDLAELVATLPLTDDPLRNELDRKIVASLREFGQAFYKQVVTEKSKLPGPTLRKW
jgi:hypothetical protein